MIFSIIFIFWVNMHRSFCCGCSFCCCCRCRFTASQNYVNIAHGPYYNTKVLPSALHVKEILWNDSDMLPSIGTKYLCIQVKSLLVTTTQLQMSNIRLLCHCCSYYRLLFCYFRQKLLCTTSSASISMSMK